MRPDLLLVPFLAASPAGPLTAEQLPPAVLAAIQQRPTVRELGPVVVRDGANFVARWPEPYPLVVTYDAHGRELSANDRAARRFYTSGFGQGGQHGHGGPGEVTPDDHDRDPRNGG